MENHMEGPREMIDEQKLIASAKDDYHSGKYNYCKATLNILAAARPNDWKVSLNRIMVDFFGSQDKNIQNLQDQLTSLCTQMNVNILEAEAPEDVEHCILFYNQAIVFFRQKKYNDALTIVNKIFPMVHEMEGNLGRKVCVLLLDLNLYLGDYEQALINLSTIEKQYNILNTIPVLGDDKTSGNGSSPADSLHIQRLKMVLLEYKARIQLAISDYDGCKETIDTLISSGCLNYSTSMIKAKLCVALQKYEDALEVMYLFMQGIDEFVELPLQHKMVFYNNLAIVNHLLTRSHSCSFFMNKALHTFHEGVNKIPNDSDLSKKYFSTSMLLKLMYNRGVSLLFRGEPAKAFDCLLEVSQKMFRSPLLWLRLAECCIRINKPGNEETFNLTDKRKDLVQGICRNKNNSNIILNNKIYHDSSYNSETQSYAVPMPTMDFASICGRNALLLLPKGNSKLRLGVLAINAYIRLSIGDPVLALKHANALLLESSLSPLYKYLGKLYVSEAYLDLNQLEKAIQMLDPTTHKDCDPMGENPGPDFLPNSQSAGQSVLLYNLAVALVIRKELEKASELLKHVWISRGTDGQVPVHVLALALYIELVQGRVDVAKTIIKQNCPQVFY
uniref:CCR4-NOT transcription complex subunit 10 n=1 Tax=Lygus hesperus TaxID=30085 RepID=A0A0A9XEE6_LYGHE